MILKGFGFAMTELLTPEGVREMGNAGLVVDERLCCDYLTLWERNRYNVNSLAAEIENLKVRIELMESEG